MAAPLNYDASVSLRQDTSSTLTKVEIYRLKSFSGIASESPTCFLLGLYNITLGHSR